MPISGFVERAAQEQPMPTGEGIDVFEHLLEVLPRMLKERRDKGIATYGVSLHTNNGRNARLDLFQELLDALAYAMQGWIEWDKLRTKQISTEIDRDNAKREVERLKEENNGFRKNVVERYRLKHDGTNANLRKALFKIGIEHKKLQDEYLSYREYADTQMIQQQREIDNLKTQLMAYQAMAFDNGTLNTPPPRDPLDVGRDLPLDDDELYSLSEDELSSAVAKAMGWKVVGTDGYKFTERNEPVKGYCLIDSNCGVIIIPTDSYHKTPVEAWKGIPKYATFEGLALRLIEPYFTSRVIRKKENVESARYEVWIDDLNLSLWASGPTLPIAACRAYLKLKMVQRDMA